MRTWWFVATFFCGVGMAMWAEELMLRAQENRLEFSAPQVHFITGRPKERLQNAAPVAFDMRVSLWAGNRNYVKSSLTARFVISYDLFEERYSVTKVSAPTRNANHMSAFEAEAWCLQQMSMDVTGVPADQPLWAKMEIRAEDEHGSSLFRGKLSENGISLTDYFVELFSGKPRAGQSHWEPEAGPVTLEQLRRGKR